MKKLIHRYLTQYFYIKGNDVYSHDREISKSSKWLCTELNMVFGMTRREVKWYIKSWCWKQSKSFNFKEYWNPSELLSAPTFPFIRSMFGSVLEMDLVRVQPMDAPSNMLMYLDYGNESLHSYECWNAPNLELGYESYYAEFFEPPKLIE